RRATNAKTASRASAHSCVSSLGTADAMRLAMNRLLLGYSPDFDLFDDASSIATTSFEHEPAVFEADLIEETTELLEVAGRPALPAALAHLLRDAVPAGTTIDRALEAELVKLLQRAAHIALPTPTALTSHDGAARASRFFGIELEGLSPEDQD